MCVYYSYLINFFKLTIIDNELWLYGYYERVFFKQSYHIVIRQAFFYVQVHEQEKKP